MARFLFALMFGLACIGGSLPGADAPRRAPDYTLRLLSGPGPKLSSFAGKVVVLTFVNTDCPHCLKTCEFMEQVQKQYGPKGLQTLAVAFDARALSDLPSFVNRSGATFPIGYDDPYSVLSFLQRQPGIVHVPIVVFVDRKGMIRGQYLGDDPFLNENDKEKNIRGLIEKLLNEPAAQSPAPKKK